MPDARGTALSWRARVWHVGRFVVGLGIAALAFAALNGQRNELVGASAELANLRVGWLLAAIGAELVSFACFGGLQRRLLRVGGVRIELAYATGLSLAAGAIANSIPAGPAFASVYAFRLYRRRGADDVLAGWTLVATLVCGALGLALVATAGVALAAKEGASYNLIYVSIGVLIVSLIADAIVWQRRWLAHLLAVILEWSHRHLGRPRLGGVALVERLLDRLDAVVVTWRDLAATVGLAVGNWVFDCAALAFSFLAVGATVPWRGLLLAYGAGQLAANLPITPGGLGLVEGSLTVALVAFGGAELSTVAAVLLYRIVSFWGYLPLGWLSFAVIELAHRRRLRRGRQRLPEVAG